MKGQSKVDKHCKGCLYRSSNSNGIKTCDYLLKTGILRGCPPGEGCTKKEVVKWVDG